MSAGTILGCFLGIRLAREALDRQVVQHPAYLTIASTPLFELPAATTLPTITPTFHPTATASPPPTATATALPTATTTSLPTATPVPLPAIRLAIPAIKVNTSIQEISTTEKTLANGEKTLVWEPVASAAAHYDTSGNPGGGQNIVLTGHNNTKGEVFRDLGKLQPGDEVILYTDTSEFHYQVQQKSIIPYLGVEAVGEDQLRAVSAPQSREMVTLISCWPYATNADRIVIVAVPSSTGDPYGH